MEAIQSSKSSVAHSATSQRGRFQRNNWPFTPEYAREHGLYMKNDPGWFYQAVKNSVANSKDTSVPNWDYKQLDPPLSGQTNWRMNNQKSRYEDFGNFNFGFAGHAFGFSLETLKAGAAYAHIKADPWKRNWLQGDDKEDNYWVQQGYKYYEDVYKRHIVPKGPCPYDREK